MKTILILAANIIAVISMGQSIAFVSVSSVSDGTAGTLASLSITKPAGVAADDLLIAAITLGSISSPNTVTVTAPAGWLLINKASEISVFYKLSGASEPASYSFTFSTQDNAAGAILAYRNVSLTTPIDAYNFVSNDPSGGTTTTIPSLTTTVPNTVLLSLYGQSDNQGNSPYTGPTGTIEQFDFGTAITSEYDAWTAGYEEAVPAVGATGSRTGTAPAANGSGSGIMVALRPANPVSVSENISLENSFSVFPNPSNGKFNLKSSQFEDLKFESVEICNIYGERIYRTVNFQINQFSNSQIDLSSHPKGIYLLKISYGNQNITKKIVVE